MAFGDGLKDKIIKLGGKQKLDSIIKYAGNPNEDVRVAVAMALGMIPTYDSGTALIPLFRDSSPMVRAAATEAAADINAKHCIEYVKSLHFRMKIPMFKKTARKAFDSLMSNTAFLARSEGFREMIEDRRMAIDLWKDIVIDVAYAFLLIQLLVIIKSTI